MVIITLATTVAIMATVTRRGGIKEQKLPTFFPARHRNATLVAMVTRRPTTMDDDDGDEMADEKSHFFFRTAVTVFIPFGTENINLSHRSAPQTFHRPNFGPRFLGWSNFCRTLATLHW